MDIVTQPDAPDTIIENVELAYEMAHAAAPFMDQYLAANKLNRSLGQVVTQHNELVSGNHFEREISAQSVLAGMGAQASRIATHNLKLADDAAEYVKTEYEQGIKLSELLETVEDTKEIDKFSGYHTPFTEEESTESKIFAIETAASNKAEIARILEITGSDKSADDLSPSEVSALLRYVED